MTLCVIKHKSKYQQLLVITPFLLMRTFYIQILRGSKFNTFLKVLKKLFGWEGKLQETKEEVPVPPFQTGLSIFPTHRRRLITAEMWGGAGRQGQQIKTWLPSWKLGWTRLPSLPLSETDHLFLGSACGSRSHQSRSETTLPTGGISPIFPPKH